MTLPNSLEAEQGVLSSILQNPSETMPEALAKLPVGQGVFYDHRHEVIYATMVSHFNEGKPLDTISLITTLSAAGKLEGVGGVGYINALVDASPSSANLSYYMTVLLDKATRRKLVETAKLIGTKAIDESSDLPAVLDTVETLVLKAGQGLVGGEMDGIKVLVQKAIDHIEFRHQNQGKLLGISTGISLLDQKTNGLVNGDMIVVGGRPSSGKTSLVMNIAESVAVDQQLPVGAFSMEMLAESLIQRMVCSRARVDLKLEQLTQGDFSRLAVATSALSKAPLFIDDTTGLTVAQLRAKARRMKHQHGIKLLVIDYLQMIDGAENGHGELAKISTGIKNLAKELRIPVIVISQIGRDVEKSEDQRKPRMSDVKGSSKIEYDADVMILLYGAHDPDWVSINYSPRPVNGRIAKQRNGPKDIDIPFLFHERFTRFEPRPSTYGI